jgi:hypothetical protein
MSAARFVKDDGGRAAAGFKGKTSDCVTRAVAIVTGRPYREVYDLINSLALAERPRGKKKRSSARTGVQKPTTKRLMEKLGATWTPTMLIGSGCKVHLCREELPSGRIVASVSRHVVAVIDGVVHDTHDSTRGGKRCVYGYWTFPEKEK